MKRLLAMLCVLLILAGCAGETLPEGVDELLSLGEQYLLDLEYEKALVPFLRVIEIEPNNVRAYLGAAEAYEGLGDVQSAVDFLERGLEATGDGEIAAMLERLLAAAPGSLAEAGEQPLEYQYHPGYRPFLYQELVDLGIPRGTSPEDAAARLGIGQELLTVWLESVDEGEYQEDGEVLGSRTHMEGWNTPIVDINRASNTYREVVALEWKNDNHDVGFLRSWPWPRDIYVGMDAAEVFEQFIVPGSRVMVFGENPTWEWALELADPGVASRDEIDDQVITIRDMEIPVETEEGRYLINLAVEVERDWEYDYWLVMTGIPEGEEGNPEYGAGLSITVKDGVVYEIFIEYEFPKMFRAE